MPKIEINLLAGNSYICSGRLSIGVILNPVNNSVILIDSGIDESTAKSVNAAIIAKKWHISAIINTHSHADHCGGNAYFQSHYPDIRIYATPMERAFIDNPHLEPWYFSSGADPIAELKNKFLQATPSKVTDIVPYADGQIMVNDVPLDVVTLPGHSSGMIGVINPIDKVLYSGDCIFAEETLDKHGVLFYTNIVDTKASLEKLIVIKDRYNNCILYHGGVRATVNMQALVDLHISKIQITEEFIFRKICENKQPVDLLTAAVMQNFDIKDDVCQYCLTRTCVLSYIASLQKQGKIVVTVEKGALLVSTNDKCFSSIPTPGKGV